MVSLDQYIKDGQEKFLDGFRIVGAEIHTINTENGFWEDKDNKNKAEILALIHSEISEALEALRKGEVFDEKCPDYLEVTVELADTIIRIMDMAQGFGYDVAGAIIAKIEYNKTRGYKHGGKKF